MTEVAISTIRQLLAVPAGAPRDAVLGAARGEGHKLAATLLTLWAAGGEGLTDAEAAELAVARERVEHYAMIWSGLTGGCPDLLLIKGMAIGALYPPGVLRSAGDLDVACPDHDAFWAAARHLVGAGYELAALTVGPVRRGERVRPHLFAEFLKEPDHGGEPYAVGLITAEIFTDMRRPAWRLPRPVRSPLALTTLALVAERWERAFRTRDLLDLTLLLRELEPSGVAELRAGLALTGLWPEWCEAMRRIERLGWRPAVALPGASRAATRERVLRAVRAMGRWCAPVRTLARIAQAGADEESAGRLAAVADTVSDLLHTRLGARRLLTAGVPLYAVPLDDVATDAEPGLRLTEVGRHLVARTPIGSFLMVAGAARQEWIDEASARSGTAAAL